MEDLLYHYCDNRKMASIISGHTLRMGDITKSNDYEEIHLFYPDIMMAIENAYNESALTLEYEGETGFSALTQLLHECHRDISIQIATGEMTSFVVCFCEDGDALSQWRGYGDEGKGGAIGFSLTELNAYCASSKDVLQLSKIKYITRTDLNDILKQEAQNMLARFKEETDYMQNKYSFLQNQEGHDFLLKSRMLHNIKSILISSLVYKYSSFAEEKEWRIFFKKEITKNPEWLYGNIDEIMQSDSVIQVLKSKIDFNVLNNDFVPYFPIDLFDVSSAPIKEIILGPQNITRPRDFDSFLAKSKMPNVTCRYSAISFKG